MRRENRRTICLRSAAYVFRSRQAIRHRARLFPCASFSLDMESPVACLGRGSSARHRKMDRGIQRGWS